MSRFNAIKDGTVTIISANLRQRISSASVKCRTAIFQAPYDNAGAVVIGGPTVVAHTSARRGITLIQGATFQMDIEDLRNVYADVEVSGDKIKYVYFD